ncbi:hypothetical protein LCGC14_1500500 [marine sediment metagenome]|uniref:Uncharacterized protein n=1 Tax=marine sediment metagenome TaxID=412755 RepID=A0A0F9LJY0_9ZZZZ
MKVECPTTQAVINRMVNRANKGMKKFGVTMSQRDDYTPARLLREAQEEALDLAIYLEELIDRLTLSDKYQEWRSRDKIHLTPNNTSPAPLNK